jgi:hypothetical protein
LCGVAGGQRPLRTSYLLDVRNGICGKGSADPYVKKQKDLPCPCIVGRLTASWKIHWWNFLKYKSWYIICQENLIYLNNIAY